MRRPERPAARRDGALAVTALVALMAGGCTMLDNALAAVPIFAFLRESPSFDPYEAPRPAPANSLPFEAPNGAAFEPVVQPVQASLLAFANSPYGRNPLQPGEAVDLGKTMYDRYCMVCHGVNGAGNGPVVGVGKFPLGPTLIAGTARGLTDGYIYAVIKAGRTLMPSYGSRVTPHERWAIVNYLRQLQGGAAPVAPTPPAGAPRDTARQ